jgi:hypothetical protein
MIEELNEESRKYLHTRHATQKPKINQDSTTSCDNQSPQFVMFLE